MEEYSKDWTHFKVHYNPRTNELHGDGDFQEFRKYYGNLKEAADEFRERTRKASNYLRHTPSSEVDLQTLKDFLYDRPI